MASPPEIQGRRKTRIVCVSDTHNQTPKLPPGHVLIHAGDLTNQGSFTELKKTIEWMERADFEVKIVIAGNHDITLDEAFYREHGNSWRWPQPQDVDACKRLLRESESITYLENETTTIRLTSPDGPKTTFTVFGSPCTPKHHNWAFQYEPQEADEIWDKVPQGVDIVVTHTPPLGLCDKSAKDDRSGCQALLNKLAEVKPMLSICGHIHGGRGVERVTWNTAPTHHSRRLVQNVEPWTDPGMGNKKLSLVNLCKTRRPPRVLAGLTRQSPSSDSLGERHGDQPAAPTLEHEPCSANGQALSTSSLAICALRNEALKHAKVEAKAVEQRSETFVVNAAHLGPRVNGKAVGFNKPIVIDVELPTWQDEV